MPAHPQPADPLSAHRQPGLLILVLVGGVAGALLRWALIRTVPAGTLPWATLLANLPGALLLGVLLEGLARRGPDEGRRRALRLALGAGVLGAFTTYSSLAMEVVLLVRDDRATLAVAYGLGSVLSGLVAAVTGLGLGAALVPRPTR